MLKKQKPTFSPKRFKSNDLKNLSESILNVCNKSILDEQLVLPTTVSTAVSSAVMGAGSSTGTPKKKPDRDGDGVPDDEDAAPDSKNYDGDLEKDRTGAATPPRKDPVPPGPVLPNVKSADDLKKSPKSPLTPGTDKNDPNAAKPIFGGRKNEMGAWRESGPSTFQGGGFKRTSTGQMFGPKEKTQKGDLMFAQRDYTRVGEKPGFFSAAKTSSEKTDPVGQNQSGANIMALKQLGQPAKDYLAKTGTAKKFSRPGYDFTAGMDYLKDQAKLTAAATILKATGSLPSGAGVFGTLAALQAGQIVDIDQAIGDLRTGVEELGKSGSGSTGANPPASTSPIGQAVDPSGDVDRFTRR